jgi:hypothetical protein
LFANDWSCSFDDATAQHQKLGIDGNVILERI